MEIYMLEKSLIETLANELDDCERNRTQTKQLSLRYPEMTLEDGYAISQKWVELKCQAGQHIIGHKIGITSKAMQRYSKISEPDYGTLLNKMLYDANGDLAFDNFIEPKVEVELAFVLGKKIAGEDIRIYDVISATDYVVPAVEIIDARIERVDRATGKMRMVYDTIADNAANAGIILGSNALKPENIDLRWISALLYKNGAIEESGVAAAVLNHPATGVAWLAKRLSKWGQSLNPGEIVLAGSFTRPIDALKGDAFHIDYGPMGSISFRFV
jgi:2-oxo-hept-3-ene-1,7-dioate hydratase